MSRSLDIIKESMKSYIGHQVKLKANKGRKRIVERSGVIESTHPDVFIVRINGGYNTTRRVSYTYSDVLTETVKLTIVDPSLAEKTAKN